MTGKNGSGARTLILTKDLKAEKASIHPLVLSSTSSEDIFPSMAIPRGRAFERPILKQFSDDE